MYTSEREKKKKYKRRRKASDYEVNNERWSHGDGEECKTKAARVPNVPREAKHSSSETRRAHTVVMISVRTNAQIRSPTPFDTPRDGNLVWGLICRGGKDHGD